MTTADRIVVMNQGGIEQVGTPEDIYERPTSEFVARFIGGSNIFKGPRQGQDAVACAGGFVLRCGSGDFAPAGDTAVSVRHHNIALSLTRPAETATNVVEGTVTRQIYLGAHRDYVATIPGNETVRVVTPVSVNIAEGETVWLHFPPEHCRALAH